MTYRHDSELDEREDFKTLPMPFALYCSYQRCQTLIRPGTLAKKFDGATYVHETCPTSHHRNFAAHKHPDTGMKFE